MTDSWQNALLTRPDQQPTMTRRRKARLMPIEDKTWKERPVTQHAKYVQENHQMTIVSMQAREHAWHLKSQRVVRVVVAAVTQTLDTSEAWSPRSKMKLPI